MAKKRSHINLTEKLACALACLLPEDERKDLRERKVPAKQVLGRFDWHHIILHAMGGSDGWHNLHPMIREVHRKRSPQDAADLRKVNNLKEEHRDFVRSVLAVKKRRKPKSKWPSRKFNTRKI